MDVICCQLRDCSRGTSRPALRSVICHRVLVLARWAGMLGPMRWHGCVGAGAQPTKGMIVATQKLSETGLRLIQGFEGFHRAIDGGERAQAYRDAVGVLTIGWGHTRTVKSDDAVITRTEAEDLLRRDVASAETAVNKHVKVGIHQNQFDALVSFVFNLGETNFRKSTLLNKLNNQRYAEVPSELMRWVNAGGAPLPGLVRRRKAEAVLFEAPPTAMVDVAPDGHVTVRTAHDTLPPEVAMAREVETVNEDRPLSKSRTMQAGTAATIVGGGAAGLEALNEFTTNVTGLADSASDSLSDLSASLEELNVGGAFQDAIDAVNQAQAQVSAVETRVEAASQTVDTVQGIPDRVQQVITTLSEQLERFGISEDVVSIGVWGIIILLILRMLYARIDDRNKARR